jgi:hypothetical protein
LQPRSSEVGDVPRLIVDLISKARRVNDCQGDTGSLFIQFQLYDLISILNTKSKRLDLLRTNGNRFDPDAFFEVCVRRIIGILALEDLLSAESVDKGGPA